MLAWLRNFKTWQKLAVSFVIIIGCLGLVVVKATGVIDGIRADMEYALHARSLPATMPIAVAYPFCRS